MIINYSPQELRDFEIEIAECFRQKLIRAPIHLADGNEEQLIDIFNSIHKEDFIFCSWRSHYHHLLKGTPKHKLKQDIINNRSISLCYPEYKSFSSAIVGGIIPISLGMAFNLKRNYSTNKVWCFIGDMTSCLGSLNECITYATNHKLPITYVVENNSKSVCTETYKVWNTNILPHEPENKSADVIKISAHLWYYWYSLNKWPHAGSGTRIQF